MSFQLTQLIPSSLGELPLNLGFVCLANAQLNTNPTAASPGRAVNIARKEKDYCGMLEYREGEEGRLLKALVTGVLNSLSH